MKRKMVIVVAAILGLTAMILIALGNMPITLESSSALIKYSVDDLINKSELIVIGDVETTLPSQWKDSNGNGSRGASPKDIVRAHGLFTDSIIAITQTLKGDIKPVVRVRTFSGEIGNIRWIGEGEPTFTIHNTYLLFLGKDTGATATVDPGDYISLGAFQGVYEIVDGKAISKSDEWNLDELIAYIQSKLSEIEPSSTTSTALPSGTLDDAIAPPEETTVPTP